MVGLELDVRGVEMRWLVEGGNGMRLKDSWGG